MVCNLTSVLSGFATGTPSLPHHSTLIPPTAEQPTTSSATPSHSPPPPTTNGMVGHSLIDLLNCKYLFPPLHLHSFLFNLYSFLLLATFLYIFSRNDKCCLLHCVKHFFVVLKVSFEGIRELTLPENSTHLTAILQPAPASVRDYNYQWKKLDGPAQGSIPRNLRERDIQLKNVR